MILRHQDNANMNQLPVIDEYTHADSRNEAAAIFEYHLGVRRIVAGPMKVDSGVIPDGKTIWPPIDPNTPPANLKP